MRPLTPTRYAFSSPLLIMCRIVAVEQPRKLAASAIVIDSKIGSVVVPRVFRAIVILTPRSRSICVALWNDLNALYRVWFSDFSIAVSRRWGDPLTSWYQGEHLSAAVLSANNSEGFLISNPRNFEETTSPRTGGEVLLFNSRSCPSRGIFIWPGPGRFRLGYHTYSNICSYLMPSNTCVDK